MRHKQVVVLSLNRTLSGAAPLAARGESPVTQKMGTATDFRSPSLLETKHFDERKSDGSPLFFTRTYFYHGLLDPEVET